MPLYLLILYVDVQSLPWNGLWKLGVFSIIRFVSDQIWDVLHALFSFELISDNRWIRGNLLFNSISVCFKGIAFYSDMLLSDMLLEIKTYTGLAKCIFLPSSLTSPLFVWVKCCNWMNCRIINVSCCAFIEVVGHGLIRIDLTDRIQAMQSQDVVNTFL